MLVEQMQIYYHKRAIEYDESMGYDNGRVVEKLFPVIEQAQSLARGRKILELACGPGFWSAQIANTAQYVVATDFNQSTLDQAIRKKISLNNISFTRVDAYNLSDVKGEFDMVFAVDWLAHVPLEKMQAFLSGVATRLPPDSIVTFIDQMPAKHSLTAIYDSHRNPIQRRTLNTGEEFNVIKHFFSNSDYQEHFADSFHALSINRYPKLRRVVVTARVNKA